MKTRGRLSPLPSEPAARSSDPSQRGPSPAWVWHVGAQNPFGSRPRVALGSAAAQPESPPPAVCAWGHLPVTPKLLPLTSCSEVAGRRLGADPAQTSSMRALGSLWTRGIPGQPPPEPAQASRACRGLCGTSGSRGHGPGRGEGSRFRLFQTCHPGDSKWAEDLAHFLAQLLSVLKSATETVIHVQSTFAVRR